MRIDLDDDEFCAQEGTNGTLEHYREQLRALRDEGDDDMVREIEGCVERIIRELGTIMAAAGGRGGGAQQ